MNSFNEYQKETKNINENQGIISIPRKFHQVEEKKTDNTIISNPKPNKPVPKQPKPKQPHQKKETQKPPKQPKKPRKPDQDPINFTEIDTTRSPVNIVFIGHVDHGKSTICGRILLATGQVDKHELHNLEQEAKQKKHEGWHLAYLMDINSDERSNGKTVEVGKAHFKTKTKSFTILDAPGHKDYVPNMISGVAQADYAVLVVSAKTGEFESGFIKEGQTREHAILAKSLGVVKLVVVINKMDQIGWKQARFEHIQNLLSPFLQNSCKFNVKNDVSWVPISGLLGQNIEKNVDKEVCSWYDGLNLFETLEELPLPERNAEGALRVPILDKFRNQGILNVFGKVESGILHSDMTATLMPSGKEINVSHIFNSQEQRVKYAKAGENVRLIVNNITEDDIKRGNIICLKENCCPICFEFEAKIRILDLPGKKIMTKGYKAVIHMHTAVEEIEIKDILAVFDKEDEMKSSRSITLKNGESGIVRLQATAYLCVEKAEINQHLGRFTLRDEGITIALGEIRKIKLFQGLENEKNKKEENEEKKSMEKEKKN